MMRSEKFETAGVLDVSRARGYLATIITDSTEEFGLSGASKSDSQSSISDPESSSDASGRLDSPNPSKWADTLRCWDALPLFFRESGLPYSFFFLLSTISLQIELMDWGHQL